MLAIAFVTPAFALAGLAAVAIPIAIHLLNRRRFKLVEWAAMSFLLAAMKKNRRRLKFESWLLLALRCLVLALLGLALARPMGCENSSLAGLAGQRSGLHVLVIDNSYSMAYEADRPDAKTHLDQAKLLAKRLIDRLSPGNESVMIISAARPATLVTPSPIYDLQAARSAVDRLEQSYRGTDLPGAIGRAVEVARTESRQPEKFLYLFTDATRGAIEGPQSQGLEAAAAEAGKLFKVSLFNLSRQDQWDQAIVGVRSAVPLVRLRFANDFLATARGYGRLADVSLQWKLDDQLLPGTTTIRPGPEDAALTQSNFAPRDGGLHVVSGSILADDRLKDDDAYRRVIDIASELKVLIVEGERGSGALAGSGAFLETALSPPPEPASTGPSRSLSYVLPDRISDLELGNKVLGDYRAIALAGVGQIQPPQADQLSKYVSAGGTLMIFVGEGVSSENYNAVLLPRGLMPGPLVKRVVSGSDQKSFHFDFKPEGILHPALHAFAKQTNTGLDTAEIYTYWQLSLPESSSAERVLNYARDGALNPSTQPGAGAADPAIVIQPLAAGHIVFVTTTANAEWTSFPAKPAFVALLHELLAGSVSGGDRWLNRNVGEPLEIPSNLSLTSAPLLKDPAQADVPLEQVRAADGSAVYRSRSLEKPGLYTLLTGSRRIPVAVNLSPDESDIRPTDPATLRKAFAHIGLDLQADQLAPIASENSGNDFGWTLMAGVLCLVGVEGILAMKFGHGRKEG